LNTRLTFLVSAFSLFHHKAVISSQSRHDEHREKRMNPVVPQFKTSYGRKHKHVSTAKNMIRFSSEQGLKPDRKRQAMDEVSLLKAVSSLHWVRRNKFDRSCFTKIWASGSQQKIWVLLV